MRIEVNEKDIEQGWPGVGASCPIALAIKRTLGCAASVGDNYIRIAEHGTYETPAVARSFIYAFDRGADVQPFSFTLTK